MKKILVTGSNGLLGQKLTEAILASSRAALVASSKGSNRYPETKGYQYLVLDVTDPEQVSQVVNEVNPDVIIHTAAMTNVDTCEKNPEECWKLNVDAVKNLVKVCSEKNIHLIHLSTDFIFDGNNGPYKEDDAVNPLSYYGKSKLESENLVKESDCKWTIIRTILVYGILKDMSRSNIVLWAKGALEKGAPINVVNDQWRMPTLVEDLAEACLLAAEKEATGVFHISGDELMSILEIVQAVADYWHLNKELVTPVSAASLPGSSSRPRKTGFILDKAGQDLGYKPHSFKEGLMIVEEQLTAVAQKDAANV